MEAYAITWDEILSSELMLSCGANFIICIECYRVKVDEMLLSGAIVIIWSYSYHLELMLSYGYNVIVKEMLSSG